MPRVSKTPASDPRESRADHGRTTDHDRLRQIHSHGRWKIIPLPAAESRRSGINRCRRRGKVGGLAASCESVDVATALCRRATLRLDTARRLQLKSSYLCELRDLGGELSFRLIFM